MSKDFSGGTKRAGFIPIRWADSSIEVVPEFVWDPAASDSLSDLIRERRAEGGDVKELLLAALRPEICSLLCQAIDRILDLICSSRRRSMTIDQIAWVTGRSLIAGNSLGALAKKHGVSKQAFTQGARQFRHLISIRSQTERNDEAKAKMRANNYRPKKPDHSGASKMLGNPDGHDVRRKHHI